MKFKSGDHVIMNCENKVRLGITDNGSLGKILKIEKDRAFVHFYKCTGSLSKKEQTYAGWFYFDLLKHSKKYYTKLGKLFYK